MGDWLPCSREQEGLWLLEQTRAVGAANNVPVALALDGRLDVATLRAALADVVTRQPALRTELAVRAGRLMWRERPPVTEPPELRVLSARDESEAAAAVEACARRALDPLRWPPLDATLVTAPGDRHVLVLVLHHIVFDGASMEPLLHELADRYSARASGATTAPARSGNRFAGFVADEREIMAAVGERAAAYWTPALDAIEDSLRLPSTGAARGGTGSAGNAGFELAEPLPTTLRRVGERSQASLFVTLLAALQALQCRYAGGGDEGVATAVAMDARPRALRGAIGMYANEAPLFSAPADSESFTELVARVRDASRPLFALRRYPFTEALARFGRGADRRESAAQLGVTYIRFGREPLAMPGVEARPLGILPTGSSRRPLTLWLLDAPDRLTGRLEFDPGVIAPDVARGFVRHYVRLLEAVADEPEATHAEVDLLEPQERAQILGPWARGPASACSAPSVVSLVERQVRDTPEAPALDAGERSLSYRELDARANQLARHLRGLGAGPRVTVAICLDRSPELVISLLAVLKAGSAYVPLDPRLPGDRLRLMLDRSRARIVVSTSRLETRLAWTRGKLVRLDRDAGAVAGRDPTPPPAVTGPDDLAYVIFTSGSTGTPKGVAMAHRPLVNLLAWQREAFALSGPVRCLQFASPSFDVAFQEIFSTLITGGTVVVVDDELRSDFERLATFIADARIERLFVPFLALNELARYLRGGPQRVEVITAGERLEITPAIRTLFARRPAWSLCNQYGPAESHVVTAHRLGGNAHGWPVAPPIGRPIANAEVYVLDRHLHPTPVGVPGELYVGGRCLADGYVDQARLTRERFVPNRLGRGGTRLYRTGDVGRWRGDGELEFLDRIDDQVKIRGHRVEPGEIRARLLEHADVRDAAIVPRDDAHAGRRLVAYVVPAAGCSPSATGLRPHLEKVLPEYMVPAAFVVVPRLPLTRNGKLDRRALPEPDWGAGGDWAEPRSETEKVLTAIWADVLGLDRVGIHDDFFRLGGHSLLAGELVARARDALGCDISLRVVFSGPTVAQMAARIERGEDVDAPIPRAERRPLSEFVSDRRA